MSNRAPTISILTNQVSVTNCSQSTSTGTLRRVAFRRTVTNPRDKSSSNVANPRDEIFRIASSSHVVTNHSDVFSPFATICNWPLRRILSCRLCMSPSDSSAQRDRSCPTASPPCDVFDQDGTTFVNSQRRFASSLAVFRLNNVTRQLKSSRVRETVFTNAPPRVETVFTNAQRLSSGFVNVTNRIHGVLIDATSRPALSHVRSKRLGKFGSLSSALRDMLSPAVTASNNETVQLPLVLSHAPRHWETRQITPLRRDETSQFGTRHNHCDVSQRAEISRFSVTNCNHLMRFGET